MVTLLLIGLIGGMFVAAIGLVVFAMTDAFGDKARYYAGFTSFWSFVVAAMCSVYIYDFHVPTHGIILMAIVILIALSMPMSLRRKVRGRMRV